MGAPGLPRGSPPLVSAHPSNSHNLPAVQNTLGGLPHLPLSTICCPHGPSPPPVPRPPATQGNRKGRAAAAAAALGGSAGSGAGAGLIWGCSRTPGLMPCAGRAGALRATGQGQAAWRGALCTQVPRRHRQGWPGPAPTTSTRCCPVPICPGPPTRPQTRTAPSAGARPLLAPGGWGGVRWGRWDGCLFVYEAGSFPGEGPGPRVLPRVPQTAGRDNGLQHLALPPTPRVCFASWRGASFPGSHSCSSRPLEHLQGRPPHSASLRGEHPLRVWAQVFPTGPAQALPSLPRMRHQTWGRLTHVLPPRPLRPPAASPRASRPPPPLPPPALAQAAGLVGGR